MNVRARLRGLRYVSRVGLRAVRSGTVSSACAAVAALSCGPAGSSNTKVVGAPTSDGTSSEPSASAGAIDAACAAEPAASGLQCSAHGYCVRPPTDDRVGAHCYCDQGRANCRPVLSHAPSGPCTTVSSKEVLVYEQGVVVGMSCLCAGGPNSYWICNGPPPG